MLYNWLIRDSESAAGRKTPVCWVKSYRRLLKCFARTTQREKASGIQIWEDEDQNIEREISDGTDVVRHDENTERSAVHSDTTSRTRM
ncbi:hypothetical protein NX059_010919 [Plenodomus lindquistii]|nr:hypothetical protein NX059_010919 [Plenodomus lindquistii]